MATLTGTVTGPFNQDDAGEYESNRRVLSEYYDDEVLANADGHETSNGVERVAPKRGSGNKALMPRSVAVSFNVKGWLASGIKVESLLVDVKRSKGLGDGVKPYKGVKYLTVSKGGVERRV